MRVRRKNYLVPAFFLLWALLICGVLFLFSERVGTGSAESGVKAGQVLARECIGDVFPAISRGSAMRTQSEEETEQTQGERTLLGMLDKTLPFLNASEGSAASDGKNNTPENSQAVSPGAEEGGETIAPAASSPGANKNTGGGAPAENKPAAGETGSVPVLDTEESKNPVVLIVHTHATESYQPVSEGNFHSTAEEGTVRDVGNELTKALEAKGIHVIHDKTLHDNPSYNESYGRSLATVKNYLAKNPSIKIVIDLHRDAAGYTGNAGKVTTIGGEKVATYSLVIGKGNDNLQQLLQFANRIIEQSNKLYPGMAGRIIEKEYRFNEYVSNQYMLLEVGNNENTIEQVRRTGIYFADVIEAYLKEYGK